MIEISLLAGESLLALLWLACRAVVWLRQKHIDWKREAALALMYVNLAVILRFVFYPMDRLNGHVQPLVFDAAAMLPLRLNLIPIVHIMRFAGRRDMLLNLVGNVAMFIPGGVLMPLLYPKLNRFWKVTAGVCGDDVPRSIDEKKRFLRRNSLAMWDVIGACDIEGSADSTIKNVKPNDLGLILEKADIRGIFVNGKTAEKFLDFFVTFYLISSRLNKRFFRYCHILYVLVHFQQKKVLFHYLL